MTQPEWKLTIECFEIDLVTHDERGWQVEMHSTSKMAACPSCGCMSVRVHSYYARKVRDVPVAAQPVKLVIRARRLECRNEDCRRKVFCERLGGLAKAYSRMSERLIAAIRAIGFALNGEGGARLAKELGIGVSGDKVIAIVRCTPQDEIKAPRVMGVDDWAYRKGQRYGTLIVDHERGVAVDLIEGRTSSPLAGWLTRHGGAQIITRDRSTEYTNAINQAAPEAQQVADRWHLLHNMRETVKQLMSRRRGEVEQTWKENSTVAEALKMPAHTTMPLPRTAQEQAASRASRTGRKTRFEEVKRLRQQGATISQISRLLDMDPKTARVYFYADVFPERKKNKSIKTSIDPHVLYLQQRFEQGCRNVMQLFREIRTRGYIGSSTPVRRWMWLRREAPAPSTPNRLTESVRQQIKAALQQITDLPSSRQLSWLLVRQPKDLTDPDQRSLNILLKNDVVRRVYDVAQRFGSMIRGHEHEQLDSWLEACATSRMAELISFARGIRSDYAAIKAALLTKWSNGPTEGHVNRLKTIKRLMFGRAKFDLLRIRVLHPT
ncbi:MAG: ISL3 family transposase [Thermoflexales bacterium]